MDAALYRTINRFADHTTWAHTIFKLYAKDGIVLFALLLAVGWLLARRDNDVPGVASVISAAGAAVVALGLGQVISHIVQRDRPYLAMPNAHLLIARSTDFSFPSDHSTAVAAVAIGLLLANRRLGIAACVLAVAMAFARVYVGAHYPGDVVAGLLLGGITAVAIRPLALRLLVPILDRVRATPLGIAVTAQRR